MSLTPTPATPGQPPRQRMPIGIQTFARIREDGCYYVDKTGFALQLIQKGTYYFLSRPRRFGKSLFLDTLAELFSGNDALFRGLAAHAQLDWSRRSPVVRISFGAGLPRTMDDFDIRTRELLALQQRLLGITCSNTSIPGTPQFPPGSA